MNTVMLHGGGAFGSALDAVAAEVIKCMNVQAPRTGLAWLPTSKESMTPVAIQDVDVAYGNANFPLPQGLRAAALSPLERYVFGWRGIRRWMTGRQRPGCAGHLLVA